MTKRIPLIGEDLTGRTLLEASPAASSADPSAVLIQCLVAVPGADDGQGGAMYAQRYIRLADLRAVVVGADKGE